ncbi:zinc ribbon domain-containing protein YjdM [Corynebacterium pacaense]|uniref:zinc ribbon domain-containing protein YjdM n=1 Tax=Corynebacterium pacaense TaxID=1816684 RepID=UPI0009BB11FD|nr:zinc ribbon domain-containing protein YjdM [Corynebacterium pacaense]
MSDLLPPCPECGSEYTYESATLLACPMCAHEWSPESSAPQPGDVAEIRDSVGNILRDGDSVSVVKSLKVKGGGGKMIKIGTKVGGIRLISDGVDGHDIEAKVPGFGSM